MPISSTHRATLALAEWLRRTADRIDPARVSRSFRRLGRNPCAPDLANLCWLLQQHQNALVVGQRCTSLSSNSAHRNHQLTCNLWRTASLLRPGLGFWYTQVQPETILREHRAGFKVFWRWKSRNRAGRPKIDRGLRDLIQRMSRENLLWGASRIHGELLMLGFEVAQSTVSKYMTRPPKPPSQTWKTFLRITRRRSPLLMCALCRRQLCSLV